MQNNVAAKTGWYIGIGAGVVLFVLLGLLAGPFLGSAMGMKIIKLLYGTMPVETLPKIILAVAMVMGLVVSAVIYVLGGGLLGLSIGYAMGAVKKRVTLSRKATVVAEGEMIQEKAPARTAGEAVSAGF